MFKEIRENSYYSLMVLLSKERMSKYDIETAKNVLQQLDMKEFFNCCVEHELESLVYLKLLELNILIDTALWQDRYLNTKLRISFMIEKLTEIANVFNKNGIDIIALKNGGIAMEIINDYGKSPMGDIDTLVKKRDFLKAHELLLKIGYRFKFRSNYEFEDLEKAFHDGGTEYYYVDEISGNVSWFEMSWRPISGRWIRLDKEPSTERLFRDSHYIGETKVRILGPEDNLLQVSIHTAKHSYVREPGFRLHLDVERIVNYYNINWDIFLEKVNHVGTKTAVYYSLFIAKELFDTPIPNDVIKKLEPSIIKKGIIEFILKKVSLLHPKEKKFSRLEFVVFQTMLYDKLSDLFRVIYPSTKWLKKKYEFKSSVLIPYFILLRILDLIGVRKSK